MSAIGVSSAPHCRLRHAVAMFARRTLALDVGKQFIRWGKTDILNPTDRFAPRDFLEVTEDEFIAVTGVRLQYERGAQSIDGVVDADVYAEPDTVVRTPMAAAAARDGRRDRIGRSRAGISRSFAIRRAVECRWPRVSSFRSPTSTASITCRSSRPSRSPGLPLVALQRTYAPLRMAGGDAAVPLPWFTVKGEIASLLPRATTPTMSCSTLSSSSGSPVS